MNTIPKRVVDPEDRLRAVRARQPAAANAQPRPRVDFVNDTTKGAPAKPRRPSGPSAGQRIASGVKAGVRGAASGARYLTTPQRAPNGSGLVRRGVNNTTLGRAGGALALLPAYAQTIAQGLQTDTQEYADRLGVQSGQSFVGDLGIRTAGVFQDLGRNVVGGDAIDSVNRFLSEDPGAGQPASPTTPRPQSAQGDSRRGSAPPQAIAGTVQGRAQPRGRAGQVVELAPQSPNTVDLAGQNRALRDVNARRGQQIAAAADRRARATNQRAAEFQNGARQRSIQSIESRLSELSRYADERPAVEAQLQQALASPIAQAPESGPADTSRIQDPTQQALNIARAQQITQGIGQPSFRATEVPTGEVDEFGAPIMATVLFDQASGRTVPLSAPRGGSDRSQQAASPPRRVRNDQTGEVLTYDPTQDAYVNENGQTIPRDQVEAG